MAVSGSGLGGLLRKFGFIYCVPSRYPDVVLVHCVSIDRRGETG